VAAIVPIPILGAMFNTRLVGIPVSVTGDWRDPTVVPAPVELLDPFLGTRRSSEPRP
jgi:hypothetical protein